MTGICWLTLLPCGELFVVCGDFYIAQFAMRLYFAFARFVFSNCCVSVFMPVVILFAIQ